MNARFFQLRNGGYDTHSDQGGAETDGQHYGLHARARRRRSSSSTTTCADMGVADKVCIVVWSEFSRRIPQNDNGTDHGSQGPMFVIGGGVNGGVYGNHPNIDDARARRRRQHRLLAERRRPFRSTDFRDVYGTILKHWLNMTPADDPVGHPDPRCAAGEYWNLTNGINLDMGFLP